MANMRAPLLSAFPLCKSKAVSVIGYVAQVCKPPKALQVIELRAASTILRLVTNSFSTNCAFQLDTLHGPRLERPVVYLHSCIVRAAAKTLQGFTLQHQTLQNQVIDSLPLAQLLPGNARPEGWDSEAFCSNLQSAYLGVHSSETFPHSRAPICSLIGDFEQGRVKGGLQAKVSLLLKSHIPNEFPLIFRRHFRTLALDQASSPLLDSLIRGTFSGTSSLPN